MSRMLVNHIKFIFKLHQPVGLEELADDDDI